MSVAIGSVLESLPVSLRGPLLDEFDKISRNYRERRWEPAELDGGKFCEVVYAIVSSKIAQDYPLKVAKPKNLREACRQLEQSPKSAAPHSIRVLIPRLLSGLYDIRNNRGVAHVGGDVDPNRMDATMVVHLTRWILAELIRVFHNTTVDQAQIIIDGLVDRIVPLVWELPDNRVRILNPSLSMRQQMLVVLYRFHPEPVDETVLVRSIEPSSASAFRRDVIRPSHKQALVDYDESLRVVRLSQLGIREVEENIQLEI